MGREAALTAKLGLDDSEIRRKIRGQAANYSDLLKENKRFRENLAQHNRQAQSRELSAEKAHHAKLVQENKKMMAEMLAVTGPGAGWLSGGTGRAMPGMNRVANTAMRTGSGTAPGGGPGGQRPGATNSGMAMLMLSQTIDDVQYGMKGIVNNIAPLVMALGGGTGLAGALTILAVGVNQGAILWKKWSGETALAEGNAKRLAEYQERLAKAVEAAGARGAAGGQFQADAVARQDAGRSSQDQMLSRAQRLADLQKETQMIEASRLEGVQRLQKEWEISSGAERTKLQKELEIAQQRLEQDSNRLADLRGEIQARQAEIQALEAREAGAPGTKTLRPDERQHLEYLRQRMPGLTEAREAVEKRAGAGFHTVEGLQQQMGPEALEQFRQHQIRIAIEAEKERKEAAQKAKEFFDGLTEFGRNAAAAFKEKINAELAKAAGREEVTGRLQVMELRKQGKNKQADEMEKGMFLQSRTAALKAEGFSDKDAAAIAAREHAVSQPAGRKRIQGVRSRNRRTGLDGESFSPDTDFDGFQDMSRDYFGLKEASTQKRTQQNLKLQKVNEGLSKAEASGDKETVTELRALKQAIVQKLDELNQTTRGTVADVTKPASAR